jgi:hypothetical protein
MAFQPKARRVTLYICLLASNLSMSSDNAVVVALSPKRGHEDGRKSDIGIRDGRHTADNKAIGNVSISMSDAY